MCMYIAHVYRCSLKPERNIFSSEAEVTDNCKSL